MSIKDFIDAMNASWPVALAVLLGAFGLLASERFGFTYLVGLPDWARGTIFIVGVFASAIFIVRVFQWLIDVWNYWQNSRLIKQREQADIAQLDELPTDELFALYWAVQQNRKVFHANIHNSVAEALVSKGLVNRALGAHRASQWPHVIADHVWREMKDRVRANSSIPQMPDPFIRGW